MAKKTKLPADLNKKAKSIVDIATGQIEIKTIPQDEIKAAASILGKKGGKAGGKARAESLTDEEKIAIAKKGAAARWGLKN